MSFNGFNNQDFDVFKVEGLDERMEALIKYVRPKLEFLGETLAPQISELVKEDMYHHVAKHARRTVNPPKDTWVAWANNKRGYKQHPHFQVGLWETHVFAWFALIYESPVKAEFAQRALPEVSSIKKSIPNHFVWSVDHMQPQVISNKDVSEEDLTNMLERLKNVKKSELLCGIHIDRHDPILSDGQALQKLFIDTFETVTPLYRLAKR